MIFEQMDLCYYSDFVYREQLLRISQQLTAQDIEKLLWLLKKVIPLARAEKISKGYQLFDDLEKQRLLGPNNLNILSNCLSATGREDLVTTRADSTAVALFSPLSCNTATLVKPTECLFDFAYRQQLLHISDELSSEDIAALLWLLKNIIPRAKAEKITEGYQLFDELEKRGYLGPCDLSFLHLHLLATSREDLAGYLITELETATVTQLPSFPSSLATTHYTQVFRMKINECTSKISSLAHIASTQAGEEWKKLYLMIYNVGHEMSYAAELDIPEAWWQPTAKPEMVDEVIQNTLQSTLAFIKTGFPCYCDPMPPTWDQIWQSCYQNYQAFDKELDKPHVKWGMSIRKKLREMIDSRIHPHGVLTKCVRDYTQSICTDLLQDENFKTQLKRVNDSLFIWESTWYWRWLNAALFHWISNLLHLAHSSVIDLSRHRKLILKLFAEHKDNINQSLADISSVVGNDILQKLSPVLELLECKPECSSQSSKQERKLTCMPALWYVLLMELTAFAEGHHINPREIGKETVHRLIKYSSSAVISSNVKVLQSAANGMHTDVLELWNHATKVADSSHYDVPVQELFPNLDSRSSC